MQISAIREIAYACPASLASSNAQAILLLLYNEEVPECEAIADIAGGTRNKRIENELKSDTEAYLLDNYPEPFNQFTHLKYYCPEGETASLEVVDMYGRLIFAISLEEGEKEIKIDTKAWKNGLYLCKYSINNITIDTIKLLKNESE